jgi:hypothetical protein
VFDHFDGDPIPRLPIYNASVAKIYNATNSIAKGFKKIDNPNKLSNAGYLLNGWKIH